MGKKGQMAIILIVGLIIVIGTILVMALNRNQARKVMDSEMQKAITSASLRGALQYYITECLKKVSIDGRNACGTYSCDSYVADYVTNNIKDCTDGFKDFIDAGFTIDDAKDDEISAYTEFTQDSFIVRLTYPVSATKGEDTTNVDRFQFLIPVDVRLEGLNGVIPPDTKWTASDKKARAHSNPGVLTRVTDRFGNPVDEITLSFIDKNFQGLSNNVVIGTTVYIGEPSDIYFDPCIILEVDVDEDKIPPSLPPEKMTLGWYDKNAKIWKAYKDQKGSVPKPGHPGVWTVTACIEHFTHIATVNCGGDVETGQSYYDIPLEGLFFERVTPSDRKVWYAKDVDSEERMHLLPEYMGGSECYESLEDIDYDSDMYSCSGLKKDWDEDDMEKLIDSPKAYISNQDGSDLTDASCKASCIQSCKDKILERLKTVYSEAEIPASGDGIKDYSYEPGTGGDRKGPQELTLVCNPTNSCACDLSNTIHRSDAYDNIAAKGPNKDNPDVLSMEFTPQGQSKAPFFATPNTYGYETKDLVGGTGKATFEFLGNGDSCIHENKPAVTVVLQSEPKDDASIKKEFASSIGGRADANAFWYWYPDQEVRNVKLEGGAPQNPKYDNAMLDTEGRDETLICSDGCEFSINRFASASAVNSLIPLADLAEPAQGQWTGGGSGIQAGVNTIEVKVENIQDPAAWAKGWLRIKGKGLTGSLGQGDLCAPGSDMTTIQERINYLCKCQGNSGCEYLSPSHGMDWNELNCLTQVRFDEENGYSRETPLCQVPPEEMARYGCDGMDYRDNSVFSPEGGKCEDGARICPDVLYMDDKDCHCGGKDGPVYDGSSEPQYCCKGKITTDDPKCRQQADNSPCKTPEGTLKPEGTKVKDASGVCYECRNGNPYQVALSECDAAPPQAKCTKDDPCACDEVCEATGLDRCECDCQDTPSYAIEGAETCIKIVAPEAAIGCGDTCSNPDGCDCACEGEEYTDIDEGNLCTRSCPPEKEGQEGPPCPEGTTCYYDGWTNGFWCFYPSENVEIGCWEQCGVGGTDGCICKCPPLEYEVGYHQWCGGDCSDWWFCTDDGSCPSGWSCGFNAAGEGDGLCGCVHG